MSDHLDGLARAIRERRAILFAGAGVSMAVGLPSWQSLIEHMAGELDLDPDEALGPASGYPVLAEYYRITKGTIAPLREWMEQEWTVRQERVRASRIHELIVSLDFPLIYTTNYDRNLEAAFELHGRPYVRIANARDVATGAGDCTQIVKFHGDFEDEESLVFTETDYFTRLAFDSPLDVKFQSDAMGRTVLFIGYSMQDTNIRLLLHRIWETWSRSGHEPYRPESFVFMPHAHPIQEAVLDRWGITLLTHEASGPDAAPDAALCEFLEDLERRVREGGADD